MTPSEFSAQINAHLLTYLPSLKTYVSGLPAETRRKWADMFLGIESEDFRMAMDDFTSGTVSVPFHRDEIATKLRAMSRGHRDVRLEKEKKQRQHEERTDEIAKRSHSSSQSVGDAIVDTMDRIGCGGALREIMRRTDSGEDGDVVTNEVMNRLRREWGMAGG